MDYTKVTYKEFGEDLLNQITNYYSQIEQNGEYINRSTEAYKNWQEAQNKFNFLLKHMIKEGKKWDDFLRSAIVELT